MKTFVWVLLAALSSTNLHSQIYRILHNFGGTVHDGYAPLTDLVLQSNTLYGTTASGGTNGNGTIFKINTDGSGYAIIKNFTNGAPEGGGMVLINNTLYGTTFTGGSAGNGTIFKLNTDGSGFVVLHNFSATVPSNWGTNSDGDRPGGDLVTGGGTLYGTAQYGGANGNGTIFKISTDGSGFAVIKSFSATFLGTNNVSGSPLASGTNSDGARPIGGLVLDGNTLYGTTYHGGMSNGVVFAVQTNGSDYTVLKYFPSLSGISTNNDGAAPVAGLALSGDALYGVTVGSGSGACGTIFKLKTNGTDFSVLHDFSHNDGAFPHNALLINGNTLYGTTAAGGLSNDGTIFMLQTDGGNFTVLKNFDQADGSGSDSLFVLSGRTLYGTAPNGGSNYVGLVFGLTVLPQILSSDESFGIQSNNFGFDITGISNQTVMVEATTNLIQPDWQPLQTNMLTGTPFYFSEPMSGGNANRFFRVRSP